MSVRLFHRGARIVLVVRRGSAGVESWCSPHLAPREWAPIFRRRLDVLALSPVSEGDTALACSIGRIEWTALRYWSTISVRLERGSATRRTLVTAALLKAARYALPAGAGH
ncbi:MAG: hypothetical protein ACRD2N_14010 [Vicinamibacterales bacterium]